MRQPGQRRQIVAKTMAHSHVTNIDSSRVFVCQAAKLVQRHPTVTGRGVADLDIGAQHPGIDIALVRQLVHHHIAARRGRDETRGNAEAHAGILDGGNFAAIGPYQLCKEGFAFLESVFGQLPASIAPPPPEVHELVDRRRHTAGGGTNIGGAQVHSVVHDRKLPAHGTALITQHESLQYAACSLAADAAPQALHLFAIYPSACSSQLAMNSSTSMVGISLKL